MDWTSSVRAMTYPGRSPYSDSGMLSVWFLASLSDMYRSLRISLAYGMLMGVASVSGKLVEVFGEVEVLLVGGGAARAALYFEGLFWVEFGFG